MSKFAAKRENGSAGNKSGISLSSLGNANDDLQLRTTSIDDYKVTAAGFGISEELVDHLNEQICSLKNECARLYNLLREKDVELRRMKKVHEEAETAGVSGITNEVVAVKIVELSKRVRELSAEVESEKSKAKQASKQVRELEQANKVLAGKSSDQERTVITPSDEDKLLAELKASNDRARLAEGRIADLRNQLEEARRETRLALRVLAQEVGEGVDIHGLLRSDGQSGWKGRAQQIQILQKKLSDLKANVKGPVSFLMDADSSDFDAVVMNAGDLSSTRQSTANTKHIEALRRLEKERKAEQDRLLAEKQAMERDLDDTKQRLAASKARSKTLQEDVKSLRDRIEQLLEKSRHDDEFVSSLLKQQELLRQSVLVPRQTSSADNNVSVKLKSAVPSEYERRITELEATIKQQQKELEEKRSTNAAVQSSSIPGPSFQIECEVVELRGLLQAANLESSRLAETVRNLHEQIDKMTEERLNLDSEIAKSHREHALLEKQNGKLKLDLEKATGRGGEMASQRHRSEVALTELEDLRAKVEVLTEERVSYRLALEKSAQQRKAELSLFENLLDETKRIFSQSVRQLARRSANTAVDSTGTNLE